MFGHPFLTWKALFCFVLSLRHKLWFHSKKIALNWTWGRCNCKSGSISGCVIAPSERPWVFTYKKPIGFVCTSHHDYNNCECNIHMEDHWKSMQKLSVVDLSCAFFNQPKMHTLQLHAVMSHVSFQDPQLLRAARHARRLRFLLPWVQHCWTWPWATLNLKDLEEFAERWAKLSESTLPWLETKVMLEELLFRGVSRNKNQNEAQKMVLVLRRNLFTKNTCCFQCIGPFRIYPWVWGPLKIIQFWDPYRLLAGSPKVLDPWN